MIHAGLARTAEPVLPAAGTGCSLTGRSFGDGLCCRVTGDRARPRPGQRAATTPGLVVATPADGRSRDVSGRPDAGMMSGVDIPRDITATPEWAALTEHHAAVEPAHL